MWIAAKLYPAGATTNSASGVTDIRNIYPALERMETDRHGAVRPRRSHRSGRRRVRPRGGVHRPRAGAADARLSRASRSCSSTSPPPKRPSSSSRRRRTSPRRSRRSIWSSTATRCSPAGCRPHAYCLPVAKREEHRLAVRTAATSGSPKFFLGTDSAPHARARQGIGLRLRRHLQRAVRARKLCDRVRGGGRARPVRGVRVGQRPALLRPAAQRGDGDAGALPKFEVPGRDRRRGAVPRRRDVALAARRLGSIRRCRSSPITAPKCSSSRS